MAKSVNSLYKKCIVPLLNELNWSGDMSRFDNTPIENIQHLLNSLAEIRFIGNVKSARFDQIDSTHLPCIFVPNSTKAPLVVTKLEGKKVFFFNSGLERYEVSDKRRIKGQVSYFRTLGMEEKTLEQKRAKWFFSMLKRFKAYISLGTLITSTIAILGVVSPFLVMLVFGQIAASSNSGNLNFLWIGILLYLLALIGFRMLRSYTLGYVGSRIGFLISNQVLKRIFLLPPSFTEMSSLGAQLARIKDFESMQDFFYGQSLPTLFEIPFLAILIGILFYLGGPVGYVPIASGLILAILSTVVFKLRKQNVDLSQSFKQKKEFQLETLNNLRNIKAMRIVEVWLERYRGVSASASLQSYYSTFSGSFMEAFSSAIISCSGLATMAIGVNEIINGRMTAPELMGCILLSMRVLAPVKGTFNLTNQVSKLNNSIKQLDMLMNLPIETREEQNTKSFERPLEGYVSFKMVSLRYTQDSHPALLGVSFDIKPGETVMITGHGGAGKTSILKLIMGMYFPQSGQILVDKLNTKQLNPSLLRKKVAYLPERSFFFKGTIRDNFLSANPKANENMILEALAQTGLLVDIEKLGDGIDTELSPSLLQQVSPSFLRRLNISMLFVKDSGLWILDNPSVDLEDMHTRQLLATLHAYKGNASIIIATQNLNFLNIADKVLYLNAGRVTAFGKPEDILKRLGSAA